MYRETLSVAYPTYDLNAGIDGEESRFIYILKSYLRRLIVETL